MKRHPGCCCDEVIIMVGSDRSLSDKVSVCVCVKSPLNPRAFIVISLVISPLATRGYSKCECIAYRLSESLGYN